MVSGFIKNYFGKLNKPWPCINVYLENFLASSVNSKLGIGNKCFLSEGCVARGNLIVQLLVMLVLCILELISRFPHKICSPLR